MACRKCGSEWTTPTGKDCNRCPACDKQQRCQARKQGRLPRETQKTCRVCGALFTATPQRQMAMTCGSESCRKAGNAEKCRRHKAKKRAGLSAKMAPRRASQPKKTCKREGCTNHVKARKHEYCSPTCAGADAREFKRGFMGQSVEVRKAIALASWFVDDWDSQRPRRRKSYKPRPPCEVCGDEVNHRHSRCCSYACKKAWRGPRLCKCGALVQNARLFGHAQCQACKRESRKIQKRMYGSYRRRCRTYGGYFNKDVKPIDVFKKDKCICHICGKKTHRVYQNHDPLSATVDHHPIPLSKGGDHDWDNVRCACKRCNELKGNKWDGQLRLRLKLA